jgi:hypothetical protein
MFKAVLDRGDTVSSSVPQFRRRKRIRWRLVRQEEGKLWRGISIESASTAQV